MAKLLSIQRLQRQVFLIIHYCSFPIPLICIQEKEAVSKMEMEENSNKMYQARLSSDCIGYCPAIWLVAPKS